MAATTDEILALVQQSQKLIKALVSDQERLRRSLQVLVEEWERLKGDRRGNNNAQ